MRADSEAHLGVSYFASSGGQRGDGTGSVTWAPTVHGTAPYPLWSLGASGGQRWAQLPNFLNLL